MRYISGYDGDERGDISVDDGRCGYMYQETSHYYCCNFVETVYGNGVGGNRSQTNHYSYHNPGDHYLDKMFMEMREVGIGLRPSPLPPII